jgi:phosphatidylglycerophosphate synthase
MGWYKEYKESLKLKELEEVFDLLFYRPLAFLLVKVVYQTKITPNHLTIASILMGVLGGCLYSVGKPAYFTAGALCYLAFNILDCSDGQLARLKKNGTTVGKIIDGISDWTATLAIYIGIAFGFANHTANPTFWWIMLTLTGICNGIHGILVDFYRNRFLDYVQGRKSTFEESIVEFRNEYEKIKNQKNKWFDRIIIYIFLRYSSVQRLLVAKRKQAKLFDTTSQEYYKKNKTIIRFWVLLGPTTQITALIICSFFNRIDVFIWAMIAGFNSLALIIWLIQHRIDRTFKRET